MFCSKCGTQVTDDARFCYKCGNALTQNAPQQSAPQVAPTHQQAQNYQVGPAHQQAQNYQAGPAHQQTQNYQAGPAHQQTPSYSTASYNSTKIKDFGNVVYPDGHSEVGDIYISNTEITFVKKSKSVLIAFGFLGSKMEKGEEKLCLPISEVANGHRTRIGINNNVFQVNMRNGESFKICLNTPKNIAVLENLISGY